MKHPRTAALTGGIASGKSTVSNMFRECGACIIDADVIARQIVEPNLPAWHEIVALFGREVLHKGDRLDRNQLGTLIFRSPKKRQLLEGIIHPRVIAEIDRQETALRKASPDAVVIVDVPLLIEADMHREYRAIMLVYVSDNIQMQRLMSRDGLPEHAARQRLAAQMPLAEKRNYATGIIDNTNTLTQTREQVKKIFQNQYR